MLRSVTSGDFVVELDLTSQVLAVEAPEDRHFDFRRDIEEEGPAEAPLIPTLESTYSTAFASASVLAQKAKIFDDGLYATVEVAAQQGAGRHRGKTILLASLGRALAGSESEIGCALEVILGAGRLGHVSVDGVAPAVAMRVQGALDAFLNDGARSKPIGFYTWSAQLRAIFQQDRILQSELDAKGVAAVARALRADPSARENYESHLRFLSRLTNPFAGRDLRTFLDACDRGESPVVESGTRFFPPSVAHETEIVERLFGNRQIPETFVLADEMIRRIQTRALDLAPHAESGWYDYQAWALEPLVIPEQMPEGRRLRFDHGYKKLLRELFKGLLALTRETHVKQIKFPTAGAAYRRPQVYIDIAPALSVEPLATFYLRRARGYDFIRSVLEETFGPDTLHTLRRLTETGPVSIGLGEELHQMEMLFLGAHVTASRELGLSPDAAEGSDTSANKAVESLASWLRELKSDVDLGRDLRAMVPVFYDEGRRKTKAWVFLGWSQRPITVSFAQAPKAVVRDLNGKRLWFPPRIRWGSQYERLPYPVTAEVYVDRLLDRSEFRRLCDSGRSASEIVRRLEA